MISGPRLVEEQWLGATVRCYADRPLTLVELLDRAVERFGGVIAVHDAEDRPTYAELADRVESCAAALRERGLRPGERVCAALGNGLDAIILIWACARGGFVYVGLPTRMAPASWDYVLDHAQPRLVITGEQYAGSLPDAVPVGEITGGSAPWQGSAVAFPDQDACYAYVYSSGTTGRPKAVQLVHRGAIHSSMAYVDTLGLAFGDRTALTFPLYYVTAHIAQVSAMMLVGGTSYPVESATPGQLVSLMADEKITYVMVVPSLWPLLLREPRFRWPDLSAFRAGAAGGAPLPHSTVTGLRERLPQLRLYDVYGLTENHSEVTILRDSDMIRKPGSIGRAVACADLRIVDTSGADVAVGEAGELCVRGPMITPGYAGDDAATAAAITDGWLHTGDLCRSDAEGFVYLLDRIKDVVIRGGNKVYSVELEYLLVRHPGIEAAAVFGLPDPVAFQLVCAYVVVTNPNLTVAAIRRWVREQMADFAVPRHVRVVPTIPRNKTGKIDKVLLRGELAADLAAR